MSLTSSSGTRAAQEDGSVIAAILLLFGTHKRDRAALAR
jgi:hypothetical protein